MVGIADTSNNGGKKKKERLHRRLNRFELVLKFYTMEIFTVSARITKIWIYYS